MAISVFVAIVALVGLANSAPSLPLKTSPVGTKWYPLNQAFPFNPVPMYMTPIMEKDQELIEDEWEDTQEMAMESQINSIRPTFTAPRYTPVPLMPTETMDRVTAMYCGSNMMCPRGSKLMPMKTMQQLVRCLCVTITSN